MKEGWTYKKLGEVGTFVRGGGFLKRDYVENGIPCIHYGQIHTVLGNVTTEHLTSISEELRSKTKFASKGDVIFAITSEDVEGSCKCTAWMGDYDVAVGGHAAIYKSSLNPAYVSYYAKSPVFYNAKKQYVHGFKVMEIKPADIAQIDIPVPSLDEQQRIVERLDAAFENIDKLKANAEKQLAEAQTLFQKSLAKAMEPKEGWEEKTLKEIVLTITDGDHQPPPKSNEGIPFITISNINKDSNKIDFEDTFYVPQHYFDGLKTDRIPQEGDVLYTVTGSFGIPVLIDYKKDFCFQRHIALIRPNQKMLFSKYLYYWILSDYAKVQAEDTATGAAQRTVSLNSLRKFRISIPPLAEQQRIVERLDALSENIHKYEEIQRQIISECDALKQALLRKVFE
ncbi:type I restriction enzyme, S subunit [Xylanibacter ruminicola]|uniref:Type I restriction enzyme, S subunit n=1 Tax=Xylanibacter ruminicola TaxID=839 RepID=A0A1M7NIY1_XYLRU|nr:restriction endonuclease subunit S [Xylanibacter ruminicola]SHN03416.1 type I restriction enzyme, S subunit [Xylanibacter ruminicola]